MVELKPGTAAFDLLVAKEKETGQRNVQLERGAFDKTHPDLVKYKCNNHGELSVMLGRGAFDKTHPDFVKYKCNNHGELNKILQRGPHNPDNRQRMNAVRSEKAKKQTTGRVEYQKSVWWKTFPKLQMFIEQVSFDYQKFIGNPY